MLAWIVIANFTSNGNPDPLPYVPLLNPLDLAQFGALLALATWYVLVRRMAIRNCPQHPLRSHCWVWCCLLH